MSTAAGTSIWDTLEHTPTPWQRAVNRYFTPSSWTS